jgi:hypothetical protein
MKPNVGSTDKIIRVIAGLALLAYALLGQGPARWFGLIGIVPLLTAFFGYCPLYTVLGMKTCATGDKTAGR